MNNFRTYELAKVFFFECKKMALPFHLKNQLDRASSSIALNLAEGSSRSSRKERRHFYEISLGSFLECRSIIELAALPAPTNMNHLGASLYKLCKALR